MPDSDLIISTTAGDVRGSARGSLHSWRGIPYAAPPIGGLRFRAPQPALPWEGVRDAIDFGKAPPQKPGTPELGAGKRTPMGEDCLTVNVTRRATPAASPRPVVVWIYGGAYSFGSSGARAYNGSQFVENGDVVYVSFNYRLGALGYLDFTRYSTRERKFDSNLGPRDQLAALQWVRDNIAAFGGDPANVTIIGQSAGANSVTTLMCVPAAHGLFARAIALSSAPTSVYSTERSAAWASDFVKLLGGDDESAVATLTSATPEQLVAATEKLTKAAPEEAPGTLSLCPVVDGDFLPQYPVDAFREGTAARVPLIIGSMDREGAFFQKFIKVLPTTGPRVERMFEVTDPASRDRVIATYPGFPKPAVATDIAGDIIFWQPCLLVAEAHSQYAPTWSYRCDFATPLLRLAGLGATHGMELGLIFAEPHLGISRMTQLLGGRRAAAAVSKRWHDRWIAFFTDGSVGADWPRYDAQDRSTLIIDTTDRVEKDPRSVRREAWREYVNYR